MTEVHDEYQYWPTWTPLRRLSIGDCGTLENGVFFTKKRPASAFGVSKGALKEEPITRDPQLRFMSKEAVKVAVQAQGENAKIPGIPQGEAGARITFTRENATVLAALGVSERRLADQYRLEQELTRLVSQGRFPPEYVVVTDVVVADSARVLISTGGGQSVTLRAGVKAGAAGFDLASLGGKLSVASDSTVGTEYDGSDGATPLFKVMGFNVGGPLRRFKQWLFHQGEGVPRIVVKSIDAKPVVGSRLTVLPIEAEPLTVAAIGRKPFVVEPRSWKPFTVEPILTDTGTLDAVLQTSGMGAGERALGPRQGIVVGSLESKPETGESLELQPFEDSPILIQPIDGTPFLVKPIGEEAMTFKSAGLRSLDVPDASDWALQEDEPLRLEYVDFGAELAVSEGARAEGASSLTF